MTRYYDIILGLIPVTLAGLTVALLLAGLQLTVAVPVSSLAAAGLIGHAMFIRGPVDSRPSPAGGPGYQSAD